MKLRLITQIEWNYEFLVFLLLIGMLFSYIYIKVMKSGIKKYYLTIIMVVLFLQQINKQTAFPKEEDTRFLLYTLILAVANIIIVCVCNIFKKCGDK